MSETGAIDLSLYPVSELKMYREDTPEVGQLVTGVVTDVKFDSQGKGKQVTGFGLVLPHYNYATNEEDEFGAEFAKKTEPVFGFMSAKTATTRRWDKGIARRFKEGKSYTMMVTGFDGDVCIVSVRSVKDHQKQYKQNQRVIESWIKLGRDLAILWSVYSGKQLSLTLIDRVMDQTVWNMFAPTDDVISNDDFIAALVSPASLFAESDMFDTGFIGLATGYISGKLVKSPTKVKQTVAVQSFAEDGVAHLVDVLDLIADIDNTIKIRVIAPPEYELVYQAPDEEATEQLVRLIHDTLLGNDEDADDVGMVGDDLMIRVEKPEISQPTVVRIGTIIGADISAFKEAMAELKLKAASEPASTST